MTASILELELYFIRVARYDRNMWIHGFGKEHPPLPHFSMGRFRDMVDEPSGDVAQLVA
jgi:hypothetical protein